MDVNVLYDGLSPLKHKSSDISGTTDLPDTTEVRKWYALTPPAIAVVSFFVDAPFGRFSFSENVALQFDGLYMLNQKEVCCTLTYFTLLSISQVSNRG